MELLKTTKQRLTIAILLILIIALITSPATATDAAKAAAQIRNAEVTGKPVPLMSQKISLKDEAFSYGIQNIYVANRIKEGEIPAGYKAGLTSDAMMKMFGADAPVNGVLFKSGRLFGTPIITTDTKGLKIELELGFRIAKPITKKITDVKELKEYIDTAFPAIELPTTDFDQPAQMTHYDLISANTGSYKFITGSYVPIDSLDINNIDATLTHNGKEVAKGKASDVLGDQWKALLWLVNDIIARGGKLNEADILLSGSMNSAIPATPGKYTADYGTFGKISFEIYPMR